MYEAELQIRPAIRALSLSLSDSLGGRMASVLGSEEGNSTGLAQARRGVQGQYVCWITMSQPKPETIERFGTKVLGDYSREEFTDRATPLPPQDSLTPPGTCTAHATGFAYANPTQTRPPIQCLYILRVGFVG